MRGLRARRVAVHAPRSFVEAQPQVRAARACPPVGDQRARNLGQAVRLRRSSRADLQRAGLLDLVLRVEHERHGFRDLGRVEQRGCLRAEHALGLAQVQLVLDRRGVVQRIARLDEAVGRVERRARALAHLRFQRQHRRGRRHQRVEPEGVFLLVGQGVAVRIHRGRVRVHPGDDRAAVLVAAVGEVPAAQPLALVAVLVTVEHVLVVHLERVGQAIRVAVDESRVGFRPELLRVAQTATRPSTSSEVADG